MVKKPDGKDAKATSRPNSRLGTAAARALEEAEERRKAREREKVKSEKEVGGRDGLDPVRYGDWEKDGTASDF
jgi:hypothetical protein